MGNKVVERTRVRIGPLSRKMTVFLCSTFCFSLREREREGEGILWCLFWYIFLPLKKRGSEGLVSLGNMTNFRPQQTFASTDHVECTNNFGLFGHLPFNYGGVQERERKREKLAHGSSWIRWGGLIMINMFSNYIPRYFYP